MEKFKSGFVSIIGRTNVGKSTLINSLLGEKVAITANKSQTTRTVIKAIINNNFLIGSIYAIKSPFFVHVLPTYIDMCLLFILL